MNISGAFSALSHSVREASEGLYYAYYNATVADPLLKKGKASRIQRPPQEEMQTLLSQLARIKGPREAQADDILHYYASFGNPKAQELIAMKKSRIKGIALYRDGLSALREADGKRARRLENTGEPTCAAEETDAIERSLDLFFQAHKCGNTQGFEKAAHLWACHRTATLDHAFSRLQRRHSGNDKFRAFMGEVLSMRYALALTRHDRENTVLALQAFERFCNDKSENDETPPRAPALSCCPD